jgi:NhaA family Na+:H+ antiporter
MSIFIAELAFRNDPPEILLAAKTGILVASFIAGLLGYVVLRLAWRSRND